MRAEISIEIEEYAQICHCVKGDTQSAIKIDLDSAEYCQPILVP